MTATALLNSPGERLKRARILAGITTRREFAQKHNISANTLQSWEQGKSTLTKKGAQRLVTALKQEGWLCSAEWLLQGSGLPPRSFERNSQSTESVIHENLHWTEEERIYREIQFFKQNNPNSIVLTISDDSMEPFFANGDIIGGVQNFEKTIDDYLGTFCILELIHNQIVPRLLQAGSQPGVYTASCTNPKTKTAPLNIYDTKIISAAPIVWHRKKIMTIADNARINESITL